ncbi:4464_t:CDS:1, partial [Ambispora leptoticha]
PLTKLWGNNNTDHLVDVERDLCMVNGMLKELLDEENFGGSYIDVKRNKVIIRTLNITILNNILNSDRRAIPLLPHKGVIYPLRARNSLSTLRNILAEIMLK